MDPHLDPQISNGFESAFGSYKFLMDPHLDHIRSDPLIPLLRYISTILLITKDYMLKFKLNYINLKTKNKMP
jgi:hypothetical protein